MKLSKVRLVASAIFVLLIALGMFFAFVDLGLAEESDFVLVIASSITAIASVFALMGTLLWQPK